MQRVVDLNLIETVRTLPCMACGITPSQAHHVTTVGAGGGDIPENLMPLCAKHHSEWHTAGPSVMVKKYPSVYHWLRIAKRDDVFCRINKSGPGNEI